MYLHSMSMIEQNIEQIHKLCEQYHVSQLSVFGSILTDQYNNESDIDLLVDFSNKDIKYYADNYFALKRSLEKILRRDVDLLENKAISNPYLRESIDSSKRVLYESRDQNMASRYSAIDKYKTGNS